MIFKAEATSAGGVFGEKIFSCLDRHSVDFFERAISAKRKVRCGEELGNGCRNECYTSGLCDPVRQQNACEWVRSYSAARFICPDRDGRAGGSKRLIHRAAGIPWTVTSLRAHVLQAEHRGPAQRV